jgi:hypothetical protein
LYDLWYDLRDVGKFIFMMSCILQSICASITSKPSVFEYFSVSFLLWTTWGEIWRPNVVHGRLTAEADCTQKRENEKAKGEKQGGANSKGHW